VLGNPLEYTDPSGACDVLINGLDQHPGWAPIDYFARNMISAFPFDDHGIVGGLDQLLYGDGGQPTAYQALKLALAQTPAGESVNVFAISGGSRAFASAFDMLSGPEQGRIGNVTYMIPGGFGALPSGNGSTTVINGKGLVNSFINHGNPVRRYSVVSAAKCDHDPACIVESAYLPTLVQTEGTSCSSPATVVPGSKGTATSIIRYGGGGGTSSGSGGQWIYIYPTQGENGDSTTPGNWVFFPGSGPPRPPSNQ
jgi:hypothetical protein